MLSTRFFGSGIAAACLVLCALPVAAQSFKVQCPTATPSHPSDPADAAANPAGGRSEEHTSELQSQSNLVCRLLLEKKKKFEAISARISAMKLSTATHVRMAA